MSLQQGVQVPFHQSLKQEQEINYESRSPEAGFKSISIRSKRVQTLDSDKVCKGVENVRITVECDIEFKEEEVNYLEEHEILLQWKLALKRLIKFRDNERKMFQVVPSAGADPLCATARTCMDIMKKRALSLEVNLKMEV